MRINVAIIGPMDAEDGKNALENAFLAWNNTQNKHRVDPHRYPRDTHSRYTDGRDAEQITIDQILKPAQVVFAVFQDRLGTPTERYDSGTAEEMDYAIQSHKPLHIFFSNTAPSQEVSPEEVTRLQKFRESLATYVDTWPPKEGWILAVTKCLQADINQITRRKRVHLVTALFAIVVLAPLIFLGITHPWSGSTTAGPSELPNLSTVDVPVRSCDTAYDPNPVSEWGPDRYTFTMEQPADHNAFNSITDNPIWSDNNGGATEDERNFLLARAHDSEEAWASYIPISDGNTYDIRMFVQNDVAPNLEISAKDVHGWIDIANCFSTNVVVTGAVTSSDANPRSVYDQVSFSGGANPFYLSYVAGSAWFENGHGRFHLSDSFLNGVEMLGCQAMDGVISGSVDCMGTVQLQVVAHYIDQYSYNVNVSANKIGTWPGESLIYTISVKNTGAQALSGIAIKADIPSTLTNTADRSEGDGINVETDLGSGTISIDMLPTGGETLVTIDATIADGDRFECGHTPLLISVTSSSDQIPAQSPIPSPSLIQSSQTTIDISKSC